MSEDVSRLEVEESYNSEFTVIKEVLGFFGRNWWKIFLVGVLVAGLAAGYVLTRPAEYVSRGAIFVMNTSGINGRAGALAASLGIGVSTAGDEMRGYVLSILNSASCQESVIKSLNEKEKEQFWSGSDLEPELRTLDAAKARMDEMVVIEPGRAVTPISVVATTMFADLSQKLADRYMKHLTTLLEDENKAELDFLSAQVKDAEQDLREAEQNLRKYAEENDVPVSLEVLGEKEYETLAETARDLGKSEVELSAVREQLSAPGDLSSKLDLRTQEAGLDARVNELRRMNDEQINALSRLPETSQRFTALARLVTQREKVLAQLIEGYESAKIDNAKKSIPYRIIDIPREPELPVDPLLVLKTALGFMAGIGLGIALFVFLEEALGWGAKRRAGKKK